jgi:hypothetical protein
VAAETGVITTVAGNGSQGYSGDGGPASLAQFSSLGGLATDPSGNLYIADNINNRIRVVSGATGIITTVAGNGAAGSSGDGGPATDAELDNPLSVAVDASGNLYIADSGNYRVRKVTLATGTITTLGNGDVIYRDARHGFPCALALAGSNLYIADSGVSRVRRVPAGATSLPVGEADAASSRLRSLATPSGFTINVTYDPSVPAAAQAAFDSLVSTYEGVLTTNIVVNIDVNFGNTGLGESLTEREGVSYSAWRAAMIANATANPGNAYAAAASLPENDPIGNGTIFLNTANARALGFTANVAVDSTLTFSNSIVFEYNGVAVSDAEDFMDVAAHELDEALGIGSALTGLADYAAIPSGDYTPEDYFRYSSASTRAITTNPYAFVYFSYEGGNTNVAQFNQAYSAQGNSDLDRNDWIYGNSGCPAATPYIQDAIQCYGQAVAVGSGPEITVLNTLGYDSDTPQTITFGPLANVTLGVAPFSISATASSGLAVSFTSTTPGVCTVAGNVVTIVAAGSCSITASQTGNAIYAAAPPVTQTFTVLGEGCTFSLDSATFSPAGVGGNSLVGLTANASGCLWTASSNSSWLTITAGSSGNGSGTVSYSIATNTGEARSGTLTIAGLTYTVNQAAAILSPISVSPGAGSGLTQTFTFTFEDPAGYLDLGVVDVLINGNFLDGRHACYAAFVPASATSGYLYLVDDAGDGGYAGGSPIALPSSGTLGNSQCTIDAAGSSVSGSGNTLTLNLAITFTSGFAGNRIFFVSAGDAGQSGWQSLATWDVPGGSPSSGPAAGGMAPPRTAITGQTYAFTFTDTNGVGDLAVVDVLTNSVLDGIAACYVAFAPASASTGYLYLVDDAGDGGYASGSPIAVPSSSTLSNSQCTINATGSSVSASGNTLTLNLAITFSSGFAGNRVFYLAARNNSTGNSGWQAVGSVTVP